MIVRLKAHAKPPVQGRWWRFNSMIVRLKEYESAFVADMDRTFQFYDSPIKSAACRVGLLYAVWRFNSMIVRLKVHIRVDLQAIPRVSIL